MKKLFFLLMLALSLQVHAQSGKTEALEALGGTCGMLLYNTYLVIGATADGYGGEVYNADMAKEVVKEQLSGIENIQKQYSALIATEFLSDPEDVKFMKEAMNTFDLIREEGEAFLDFVDSGSNEDAENYDASRKAAWHEIARLLGIDE
jgi:hypothetical protein